MKYFIVIIAVINCVLAVQDVEDVKKKAEEFIKACIEQTGISEENANKIKAGDFSVRDEQAQCFTNCFFKKAGFMNDKGELQVDVMINKLSYKAGEKNEVLEELINKCIKEKGETECETSFKIYECYRGGSGPSYGSQVQ